MQALSRREEKRVLLQMAKEFLETRLGITPTPKNVIRFAKYINRFERDLERCERTSDKI